MIPASAPSSDRADLAALLARAVALFRQHEPEAAQAACLALIEACPQDRMSLEARWWRVRIARRESRLDEAMQVAHEGLAAAQEAGDTHFQCRFHALIARTLNDLGQNEDAVAEAETALRLATTAGDEHAEAHALEALGCMHWAVNEVAQGLAILRRLQTLAEHIGDLDLQLMALLGQASMNDVLGNQAQEAGRADEAGTHWGRALELHSACSGVAQALGDRYLSYYCDLNRACTLQISGALEAARAVYQQVLAGPAPGSVRCQALIFLGGLARNEGRLEQAIALLQQAIDDPSMSHRAHLVLMGLAELVDAQEAAGNLKAALAAMRRLHATHLANASEKAAMRARAIEIRLETERAKARAELEVARSASLERRNEDLTRLSLEDGLTGVANRRCFDEALRNPPSASYSLALLDIDHFKRVNDGHSHLVGDAVLRRIAAILQAHCRRTDLVARYGGEEFVLILEGMEREAAAARCERIRAAVEAEPWNLISPGLAVTVSAGVATNREIRGGMEMLVALADRRLYAAKNDGRNRVTFEGPSSDLRG